MPSFTCPHCQKTLNGNDAYIGRAIRCPACSKPFTAELPRAQPVTNTLEFLDEPQTTTGMRPPKAGPSKRPLAVVLPAIALGACLVVLLGAGIVIVQSSAGSLTGWRSEKNAIRLWLKENEADPKYEEVKWYPFVSVAECCDKHIKDSEAEYQTTLTELEKKEQGSQKKLDAANAEKKAHGGATQYVEGGRICNADMAIRIAENELRYLDRNYEDAQSSREAEAESAAREKGMGGWLVQLKFRAETPLGGKMLKSMVFRIRDGVAKPADPSLENDYRSLLPKE